MSVNDLLINRGESWKKYCLISGNSGFTLIELMIAIIVSSMVAIGIYAAYSGQQKIYDRQEAVVDMQQNMRAGLYLIGQELRMAGYDPKGSAGAGIVSATSSSINFTQDITNDSGSATDGDGNITRSGGFDPNENVTLAYDMTNARLTRDTDGTGGAPPQPLIDNVDFLEFAYIMEDGSVTLSPSASTLGLIRAIQISMLVRSSVSENNFVNNRVYRTPQIPSNAISPRFSGTAINGGVPYNDNFRRLLLYTTVQCRNLGL